MACLRRIGISPVTTTTAYHRAAVTQPGAVATFVLGTEKGTTVSRQIPTSAPEVLRYYRVPHIRYVNWHKNGSGTKNISIDGGDDGCKPPFSPETFDNGTVAASPQPGAGASAACFAWVTACCTLCSRRRGAVCWWNLEEGGFAIIKKACFYS